MAFNSPGDRQGGKKDLLLGLRQALGNTRLNYSARLDGTVMPQQAPQTEKQDCPDGPFFQRKQAVPLGAYQSLYVHQELVGAVSAGNLTKIKEMVEHNGADPNFVNPSGWTTLHWAVQFGQKVIVSYLLSAGADTAILSGNTGHTPLHRAAILGDAEMGRILVEEGEADVRAVENGPSGQKDTVLHLSAMFGHQEMVLLLKEKGADVLAVDSQGVTPRERALSLGMFSTAKLLGEWEDEVKEKKILHRIEKRVSTLLGSSLDDGEDGVTHRRLSLEKGMGRIGMDEESFMDSTPRPGQTRVGNWGEDEDEDTETFWDGLV